MLSASQAAPSRHSSRQAGDVYSQDSEVLGLDVRSVRQGAAILTAAAGVFYSVINSGSRLANPAAIRGVKSDSGLLLWVPHNLPLPIQRTLRLALQCWGFFHCLLLAVLFYLAVCVWCLCSNFSALKGTYRSQKFTLPSADAKRTPIHSRVHSPPTPHPHPRLRHPCTSPCP